MSDLLDDLLSHRSSALSARTRTGSTDGRSAVDPDIQEQAEDYADPDQHTVIPFKRPWKDDDFDWDWDDYDPPIPEPAVGRETHCRHCGAMEWKYGDSDAMCRRCEDAWGL